MCAATLENPALRRMIRPAKPSVSGSRMVEARAWQSALPRVTESRISTVATVVGYEVSRTDLDAILGEWDGYVLALLLDGPDGAKGLVRFDDELRTALVEAQTIGRVLATAVSGRAGTTIDAALCDHVVTAWLDGVAAAIEAENAWKIMRIVKDARAGKVALLDGDYAATTVTVALGEGARVGVLQIIRPEGSTAPSAGEGAAPAGAVSSGLLALEAELEAILYRTKVPLRWLRQLAPGAVLEIPRQALHQVQIETIEGKRVSRAKLGQKDGKRAVRLIGKDEEDEALPTRGRAALSSQKPPNGGLDPKVSKEAPDPPPLGPVAGAADAEPLAALPDMPGLPPLDGE